MRIRKTGISLWIAVLVTSLLYGYGPNVHADAGGRMWEVDVTRYDGFSVIDAKPTEDGGYILAGRSGNQSALLKTDAEGKELWRKQLTEGTEPRYDVRAVIPLRDNEYMYAAIDNNDLNQSVIGKLNADQEIAFSVVVEGSVSSLLKTDHELILLTGYRRSANGELDPMAVMLNPGSSQIFNTTYAQPYNQFIHASLRSFKGTHLIGGSTQQDGVSWYTDALLTEVNLAGVQVNQRTYGTPDASETIEAMAPVNDFGYILTGNVVIGSKQEIMLLKLDANLDQEWMRTYPVGNHGVDVKLAFEGGYVVSGTDSDLNMLVLKTDEAGNMQWVHHLSEKGSGSSTKQNPDGSYSFLGGDDNGGWYALRVAAPEQIAVDDLANLIVGTTPDMEFSTNAGVSYTSFAVEPSPTFPGNEEVWVRYRKDREQGYGAGQVQVLQFTANAADARLHKLAIDGLPLTGFDPELEEYTIQVSKDASSITVTASTYEPAASLLLDGQSAQSGQGVNVPVIAPTQDVVIEVTAADRINQRNYTLHVVQETDPATGEPGGPENPENPENPGNPGNPETPEEPPVQPENPSVPLVPSVPSSPMGQQSAPAAPAISSNLTGLNVSPGKLEPAFSPEQFRYRLTLTADTSAVTLHWPVIGQNITVNGSPAQQGNITLVNLNPGSNPVTIGVKGLDDEAKEYYIDIVRGETVSSESEEGPALGQDLIAIEGQRDWADRAMAIAAQKGIVQGYGDGTYRPHEILTRLEYAVMLQRMLQLPLREREATQRSFKDQENIPAWGLEAVLAVSEAGIMQGYPNGKYAPDLAITRAEMSAIVVRAFQLKNELDSANSALPSFHDVDQVALWARPYVQILQQHGIVKGRANNRFAPQDNLTRAEAVMVLLRIQQMLDS
ncbi:hypothetical protein B2I21_30570 [Chryseobacterium mucoviscidosis]|nr:hypothetical protein B2I21_30570 [Chryseobacterium mucoviscidosis]